MRNIFTKDRRHPVAAFAKDNRTPLLIGLGTTAAIALVAGLGKRRRQLVADRAGSLSRTATDRVSKRARDLRNRTRGVLAETRNRFSSEEVDDEQLEARIRSQLGHHVRHAGAITTSVQDGIATLTGDVLAAELGDALECVRRVRGVQEVRNRLSVHEDEQELVEQR